MSVDTLQFQLPQEPASAAVACREGVAARKAKVIQRQSTHDRLVAVYLGKGPMGVGPLRFEITVSPATPDGTAVAIKGRLAGFGPVTKALLRRHMTALRESIETMPPVIVPIEPLYVRLADHVGSFAGDADIARELRESILAPAIRAGERVIIDCAGVELSTDSFIQTLVSDLGRSKDFFALIDFRNASASVRERLESVVEASQDHANEG